MHLTHIHLAKVFTVVYFFFTFIYSNFNIWLVNVTLALCLPQMRMAEVSLNTAF